MWRYKRNIFMMFNITFNITSVKRGQQKAINFMHSFIDEVYVFVNILYYFFSLYNLYYYIDDTAMDK